MKKDLCEICGREIHPHSKRRLNGAIRVITMAQDVCIECKEKVERTDWNCVVRREIMKGGRTDEHVRGENGMQNLQGQVLLRNAQRT